MGVVPLCTKKTLTSFPMATAGYGTAPSENSGAVEKSQKSSSGMSSDQVENATTGILELERISKQPTCARHKIQHPTTMEDLPDEVLVTIFIRFLAKQLARMRPVSKSWNAFLSHPSFVKSHLHRSIRNNNQQILLVFSDCYRPITQYSCKSPNLEPTIFIKHIPANLPRRVLGSVNGLICLSDVCYSNIHIWNPSLSAVSAIPLPRLMLYSLKYDISIGFGFDPKTGDYKLVKISGVCGSDRYVKEWLQVEVYSLRKGSWEFITQPFPSHIKHIFSFDYLCVDGHDGHLHWQDTLGPRPTSTIVAFDLSSETFREMPLPHSILDSKHEWHELGVLGGKLCVMTRRDDGAWEVWVMEEYGVPESWVKRHVFSQFNKNVLFGFTSRSELLFRDKGGRLALYDPIANKTKKTRTKQSVFKIVEYVDSLVWV